MNAHAANIAKIREPKQGKPTAALVEVDADIGLRERGHQRAGRPHEGSRDRGTCRNPTPTIRSAHAE